MKASQLKFQIQISHQMKLMMEKLARLAKYSYFNLLPHPIESRKYTIEL